MTFEGWIAEVPKTIRNDVLWKHAAYRKSLFLSDLSWSDVSKLIGNRRTISVADQLYRAVGSISANVSEGYSKSSPKDRVRFYEYALGSSRESRDWYFKARHILGAKVFDHRAKLLEEIIRLLLTMISGQTPIR